MVAKKRTRVINVDTSIERLIVTGFIVDTDFCRELAEIVSLEYFQSKYVRLIAQWALEYYDRYEKACGEDIEKIFQAEKHKKEVAEEHLIERFLGDISDEYGAGGFNSKYTVDQAIKYFKKRDLQITMTNVQIYLEKDDLVSAEEEILNRSKVDLPTFQWCNPFGEIETVHKALEASENKFFEFEGGLKKLVGPIDRGFFIGMLAPMKRGKTFEMLDWAVSFANQKLKVAFISLEMSEEQVNKRLYKMITGYGDEAGKYHMPVFDCAKNQTGECVRTERENSYSLIESQEDEENEGGSRRTSRRGKKKDDEEPKTVTKEYDPENPYRPCTYCRFNHPKLYTPAFYRETHKKKKLSVDNVWRRIKSLEKMMGRGNLQVRCFPKFSANVRDLQHELNMMEHHKGFLPDVIVVDYADILGPENVKETGRERTNSTWMTLAQMASTRNAVVVTASQSNRPGIKKDSLEAEDTAEDIRKIAHVDFMLSLNQTKAEKEANAMRLGLLAHRHKEFSEDNQALVLTMPSLGQINLDSILVNCKGDKYFYLGG